MAEKADINKNESANVWRTWDDGYVVRAMLPSDTPIVQEWYKGMGMTSRFDLDVCLEVYPPGPGFYIGEKDGEIVASAIRIPWGDNVFYGSYYYVAKEHRGGGYGTRLRDQVAREYVGNNTLCVDAVMGKVAANNRTKFGYIDAFISSRFEGVAKADYGIKYSGNLLKACDVSFDDLMQYDNKHFVSKDFEPRRKFMFKWISLPEGATYVAVNEEGTIVGLCCRRKCIQEKNHQIGPLYADSAEIAESLLQRSCQDVVHDNITLNIWQPNADAVEMVNKWGMSKVFDTQRMHINEDPKEFKKTVFAVTSIDACGF